MLRKIVVGSRVFFLDDQNKLLFTKAELEEARQRFIRERQRRIARGG